MSRHTEHASPAACKHCQDKHARQVRVRQSIEMKNKSRVALMCKVCIQAYVLAKLN